MARDRALLIGFYIEERSKDEVCAELGIPPDHFRRVVFRARERLRELFDKPDLVAFPVVTGTAANSLALACCSPPWGAIFCHPSAHIAAEETGAPEFYTGGARQFRIDGAGGKIDPAKLADALAQPVYGVPHFAQPAAVSITQATECGTVYGPDEIAAASGLS